MASERARRLLRPTFLFFLPIMLAICAVHASAQVYVFGQASFATGANPRSVVTADFSNDGRLDLAVANYDSNSITILLGKPDGTFASGVDYAVGQGPRPLAAGDLNGDGNTDLIVANSIDSTVSVLLGNGDGTFQNFTTLSAGNDPTAVILADLNHDGKLDIAITNAMSNTVSIWLGNGDGMFQPRQDYPTGDSPAALAVGDFNVDGNLDLAIANQSSNTVSILLGNGNGTFRTRVDYASGKGPISLVSGDFNGDGLIDLVAANSADQTISVLIGRGDGTFQNPAVYFLGMAPVSVIAGDFNGDKKLDLVLAGGPNPQASLLVLLGRGDGTFQPRSGISLSSEAAALCAGDFNGDGGLDLAIAYPDTNLVTVLINDGNGTFRSYTEYAAGSDPSSVIIGDFIGDGILDLATNDWEGDSVSVLLGNGDGTFRTHADYAVAGPPSSITTADFKVDGRLDLIGTNDIASGSISFLAGAGDGTFLPSIVEPAGMQPQGAATGDFNGDGKPDLVLTDGGATPFFMTILLGNGDGTFRPGTSYAAGSSPRPVIVGDFNDDGRLDIAVGNTSSATVSIFLGNGDGTFQSQRVYPTGDVPYSLVTGDFNGDGKLDLATANLGSNTVSVLLGNGDGTFQSHVDYPTGAFTLAVTAGDLNGDGKLDLVVSNFDANTISVLLGNGDGSFQPHLDYATGNGPGGEVTGDFNRDGELDLAVTAGFDNAVSVFLNTPVVAFYPSQLTFVGRPIGTSSPPQIILVSNPGSMPVKFQTIATIGDFTQANACANIIAVAGNCPISLTFSPTATGIRTGALIITDNVASSPHVITLKGGGTIPAPVASLSATSLVFTSPGPGSPMLTQVLILTNTGNVALTISSIVINGTNEGDFSQSTTCGNAVNPGANCSISVGFSPTTFGNETATLVISDNANASQQRVVLAGMITGTIPKFSPSRLVFLSQPVGTTSPPFPVTLTASGASDFSIQSIIVSGDFAQSNNCGTSIFGNTSCTINVTFTPTASGDRGGNLTILHNGLPTVMGVNGSGGDFSITAPISTATVVAGQTVTYTSPILTPIGGFDQAIALKCSGAPSGATCIVPPSASTNGLIVRGFVVTVITTTRSAAGPGAEPRPNGRNPTSTGFVLPLLVALGLLSVLARLQGGRPAPQGRLSLCWASTLFLILITAGCGGAGAGADQGGGGGAGNTGTPAGTYTLTVTGTFASGSATLTHSLMLTLTVH